MWLSNLRDICIEVPFNEPGKNVKIKNKQDTIYLDGKKLYGYQIEKITIQSLLVS